MRENFWRRSADNFSEGAQMALANAAAVRKDGDEKAAQDAERRATKYLAWAEHDRAMADAREMFDELDAA